MEKSSPLLPPVHVRASGVLFDDRFIVSVDDGHTQIGTEDGVGCEIAGLTLFGWRPCVVLSETLATHAHTHSVRFGIQKSGECSVVAVQKHSRPGDTKAWAFPDYVAGDVGSKQFPDSSVKGFPFLDKNLSERLQRKKVTFIVTVAQLVRGTGVLESTAESPPFGESEAPLVHGWFNKDALGDLRVIFFKYRD